MRTDDLREAYMKFFQSKGCVRRPSDVLVPRGDPSVLFTPAGMNQFKEQFLGLGKLDFTRAVTCQKCLRTGDIDQVGKTAYHHTFFEMLGNFSFGDYFKKEAIHWAWEFLTSSVDAGGVGLAGDRLSATVFLKDDEAYDIWRNEIGLPDGRLRRDDEHENFWPAGAPSNGPDGVCGPCSEIFYHCDDGTEVEIWNLVFTQFNRAGPPPDNLTPLPRKNIDTGMGLERTAAVLQGVASNFEIDIFRQMIAVASELTGVKYDATTAESSLIRRICDHARGVTFCIHENVLPSNEKQGYVVRRLLRRAVLDGYQLGMRAPFFHRMVPIVAEAMKVPYPELSETAQRVTETVRLEEERFLATLEKGIQFFENAAQRSSGDQVHPEDAFNLHATYGFPIELTEALAEQRRLGVDRAAFEQLMEQHAEISGKGAFSAELFKIGPVAKLKETLHSTEFLGYETTQAEGVVRAIIAGESLVEQIAEGAGDEPAVLVLDRSPFYGEAGGQVGDTGVIEAVDGTFHFEVEDTQREDELILHRGRLVQGKAGVGDRVRASVDSTRRAGIRRAHSATHLLHYALRQVLGSHAQQAGSKVDDDYLRFDFANPQAVPAEQLRQIEDDVQQRVLEASSVQWEFMPLEKAKESGAMALFGEKYPDTVRVVSMGDYSRELCGGTHLNNTSEVGLVKIVGEESVSAGTRRITALTGKAALHHVREEEQRQTALCALLRSPPTELPRRVEMLLGEVRTLKRQLKERSSQTQEVSTEQLLGEAVEVAGARVIAREVAGWDQGQMRAQIDQLRRKGGAVAVLFASRVDGRVQLIGGLSRELVDRGLQASAWIREVAPIVGGGGGGRADMAQAGGKNPERLDEALRRGIEFMKEQLEAS